ncbi:MAG: nucleotidyltransferase domain-containing protein [Deltaproteobacteria bacterium]|nr:nucleotidyltransferase domain-containing protein [Deltaproteobacteria bacterium]
MIDVSPSDLKLIQKILQKHVPTTEVRVFGSRVTGKAKPHSDLDLAIVGKEKIPSTTLSLLKADFEESDLPFRVDVLDWNSISNTFQNLILEEYEVLHQADF